MISHEKKIRVAIDGPVSSGKTSVGSLAAKALGYLFIDTGLMYRALAYKILQNKIPEKNWVETAKTTTFNWNGKHYKPDLILDGENVMEKLSLPQVASFTSKVAVHSEIRKTLVEKQREMAQEGVVMVGRDIGTVVLPFAELKIFLTASVEARVDRRFQEYLLQGITMDKERLKKEILERDERDMTRKDSPLVPAKDAILLDTTSLSLEEVVDKVVSLIKMKER
jgi:cytidylate kinase